MSECIKFIWGETGLRELTKYVFARVLFRPKTSQIEALRRKYEALLQEDKKRKERNDYILEKMDNMRTCTTLAHTKQRSDFQLASGLLQNSSNRLVTLGPKAPGFETQFYQGYHDNVPRVSDTGSASSLLKDIYNKFILIPKRWPNQQAKPEPCEKDTNNIEQINTDANSDWKTKYDILNKLKQEEKEYIGHDRTEFVDSEHQQEYEYPNQPILEFKPDLPEKDVSKTVTLKDKNKGDEQINDIFVKNKQFDNRNASTVNDKNKENYFSKLRSPDIMAAAEKVIDSDKNKNKASETGETKPYPFTKIEGSEKIEHLDDEGINPAHISYPSENVGKPFGDVPDVTEDVQYPIEIINVDDFTPQLDVTVKDGVNINPEGYGLNRSHFEQFSSHEEFPIKKDEAVNDDVNVSPEVHVMSEDPFQPVSEPGKPHTPVTNIEQVEPSGQPDPEMALVSEDSSGDQTDTKISYKTHESAPVPEHKEDLGNPLAELGDTMESEEQMFYTEPANEIVYDQNAAGDTWDSTQNENFEQNQQYYYEGPHETPESVQINEHEETSTPYDQNYEQQYNMANYEQQEYGNISQPLNPPQVAYDQPQEYDTQQYEHQEYDQSGYDQSGQPVYDQHGVMAQYNAEPEYDPQQYQQENYETVQQVEDQLNQEEGYTEIQDQQQEEIQEVASEQQPGA